MSDFPPPPPPTGGPAVGPRPGDVPLRPVPEGLQPLNTFSTILTILLVLSALLAALTALTFAARVGVIDDFLRGDATHTDYNDATDAIKGVTTLSLFTLGATAIVWIMWQYRYVRNAERFGRKLQLGPGWAIGGWLIPLANLVLPARQLKESAEVSDGERRAPQLLYVWAATWAVANLVLRITAAMRPELDETSAVTLAEGLEGYQGADKVTILAFFLYVAAAIFAIVLVRRLSRGQTAHA